MGSSNPAVTRSSELLADWTSHHHHVTQFEDSEGEAGLHLKAYYYSKRHNHHDEGEWQPEWQWQCLSSLPATVTVTCLAASGCRGDSNQYTSTPYAASCGWPGQATQGSMSNIEYESNIPVTRA